jgi:predicted dehydrogenase
VTDHSALLVGAGSIGQRHARNLRVLGVRRLAIWDPEPGRAAQLAGELAARAVGSFEEGLADGPSCVFVCSPPSFHVGQALAAVRAGTHVFIEKPLGDSLDGVDELAREAAAGRRIVQVGYNLRFLPAIRALRRFCDEDAIGRVLWLRAEFGQYLPDWRPRDDYRRTYSARRALGGGIILDASHEIDYVLWLLGRPVVVKSLVGTVSRLELDVEDCATILLRFASGAQADLHLDCVQRAYSRSCKIVGESGTLEWAFSGPVRWFRADARAWREIDCASEFAQAYVDETVHFFECIDRGKEPVSNLESARLTLEVALAARDGAKWSH